MNDQQKYLKELTDYLSPLKDADRDDALEFYEEYLDDAGLDTITAIEEKLGTPRQLSYKILADYSIKDNDESTQDRRPASAHSSWRTFWWILVAIVTSPLTFGFSILLLCLLIAAGGVAFGLIVAVIAIVLSIAGIAVASTYIGIGLIATAPFSGLFYLGIGLSLIGLFLICIPLSYWFIRLIIQGIANFAKFLYNKIQTRRESK